MDFVINLGIIVTVHLMAMVTHDLTIPFTLLSIAFLLSSFIDIWRDL